MIRYFFTSVCILLCGLCPAQKGKVLLAVFAHPDDEGTVSPVLTKYARAGASVYIVIATDGGMGVSQHAGIPEGDSLAAVRAEEMKCAAKKIGAHPPVMLGRPDQLDMYKGMEAQNTHLDTVRQKLNELIKKIQPDVILTWGPSGWTGHPDHILVGALVADIFQSQKWNKPVNLYFSELPKGIVPSENFPFAAVDTSYLTVRVPLSSADLSTAKSAWLCHKSQYTPEQVDEMYNGVWMGRKPIAYFRPFIAPAGGKIQHTLFP